VDIAASILEACRYGTNKTHTMYQCNLSSKQLEGYLDLLSKANLLVIENDHRRFMLTVSSKGKHFLKVYNGMKSLMQNGNLETENSYEPF
jgi:predicted transcriptional regulator